MSYGRCEACGWPLDTDGKCTNPKLPKTGGKK